MATHVFLAKPDLIAEWAEIAPPVYKRNQARVTGLLRVSNQGTENATGFRIAYALSDSPVPDTSNAMVGRMQITLSPGKTRLVKFTFLTAASVSGKYLVAQITSKHPEEEANITNNVASGLIP